MSEEAYTVDEFKKILDSLSYHGFGSMPILLGTDTPLLDDSIYINYLENKLLIRNSYYDKQLVDAAEKLKDSIDELYGKRIEKKNKRMKIMRLFTIKKNTKRNRN